MARGGGRGGGGGGRGRDTDKEEKGGPSKNQLKGLSYNDNKPKFLQNIATALSGASSSSGRPPIPTRPDTGADDDDDNDFVNEDLGDEAPQVVVLREGKHMTAQEADEAKKDLPDPSVAAPSSKPEKRVSTLRFSSKAEGSGTNKGKRKAGLGASYEDGDDDDAEQDGDGDAFSDLVKRAKTDPSAATQADIANRKGSAPAKPKEDAVNKKKAPLTREEKSAMKAKRKAAKKMLSFED